MTTPAEQTARAASSPFISICIVCRNEADKLGPCLESAAWADEIVMMDLESSDGSAELAASHGAKVIRREPVPIVEQVRNEVADAARGEWIVPMDPDERVTPGLAEALRSLAENEDIDVVMIPFMNYDLGYPASHPVHRYDPKPRMYRKSKVRWPEVPNALPEVPEERIHRLPNRDDVVMIHDRNRNIPEVLDRVVRYAPAEARSMIERGEQFTVRRMFRVLGGKAYKQFIKARALRDGVPGLMRASILVAFHFYIWAAFWHMSGAERTSADDRFLRRLDQLLELGRRFVLLSSAPLRWTKRLFRD